MQTPYSGDRPLTLATLCWISAMSDQISPQKFSIGDRVHLAKRPAYFKTAEPMPMLRPPDLIPLGSEGTIDRLAPGGSYVVRFSQGSFLVNPEDLQLAA
ncbi:MAG: NAD(P)H dehydrogenase assembly family protein [Prochlorotrichaceae cyanobacterium]